MSQTRSLKGFGIRTGFLLGLFAALGGWSSARADRPADSLLKRLPEDAGLTLAIEDLKGHADRILNSPFHQAFERLPAYRSWRDSDGGRKLQGARAKLEIVLETSWTRLRDDLFGDAVVLCFQLPRDAGLEEARGLVLIKPGDGKLLRRVVDLLNKVQAAEGGLEVTTADHRGLPIVRRAFGAPANRVEYYVIFDDGIFAWSNSERAIKEVVDRHLDGGRSLADRPEIKELRDRLPARALASLIVNPRLVERLLALAPVPEKEDDKRAKALVEHAVKSMVAFGMALEWRGGILLHAHEIRDPKSTPAWLRDWAAVGPKPDELVRKLPSDVPLVAAGKFNFVAAYDAARSLIGDDAKPTVELVLTALKGVLLDKDPVKEVLPRLGPGMLVYVDAPSGSDVGRNSLVGVVEIAAGQGDPAIRASLDTALRTFLAIHALDPKRQALRLRVETKEKGGRRLTSIAGGPTPFTYSFGPGYLIVGTSEDGVARFDDGSGDDSIARLRSAYFPDAAWYARADLTRLSSALRANRADWIKRIGSESDFEQVLGLLGIFPNAFVSMTIDKEVRSIHRVVGLVSEAP